MKRGERTVMASIHGLQHIQRLASADLTHHNALRSHTQGGLDQIPDRDLEPAGSAQQRRIVGREYWVFAIQTG